jgi:hypothetical protein
VPLARYEDGSAAILEREVGPGRLFALGIDVGALALTGYNNREEGIARAYVNAYEPLTDVFWRFLRQVYREGEPAAVTLGPVPGGRELAVVLTHDIDSGPFFPNMLAYAAYERGQGIHATYFVQTKYVRDFSDEAFFTARTVPAVQQLAAWGMEVASHTVCHSHQFTHFPLGTGDERYPAYRPRVETMDRTSGGTVLGELRVSRFLLDGFIRPGAVCSFRPGQLLNPRTLPQALAATGYRFSSSVTANSSLTHLPFQLNHDREAETEVGIYEFPITIEDLETPPMLERLPQALALAGQLRRQGATCVILIHPDDLGSRFQFEQAFVAGVKDYAWFGALSEFGEWWAARDAVGVDLTRGDGVATVTLEAPRGLAGLTLQVPPQWRFECSSPTGLAVTHTSSKAVIGMAQGRAELVFTTR